MRSSVDFPKIGVRHVVNNVFFESQHTVVCYGGSGVDHLHHYPCCPDQHAPRKAYVRPRAGAAQAGVDGVGEPGPAAVYFVPLYPVGQVPVGRRNCADPG